MDLKSVLRVEREQDRQQDHADHEGNQDQRKSGYDIILELESAEADDHCVGGYPARPGDSYEGRCDLEKRTLYKQRHAEVPEFL